MEPNAPNFFILGAAKAGTTTLHEYLSAHPDIYMSRVKEPQFFSHDDVYHRGLPYYRETFFGDSAGFMVRGEATPHYLFYEKAAQRIARDLPADALRFIVMVRDPVARAYSLYWNMVAEGLEHLPFAEALLEEEDRSRDPALQRAGAVSVHYAASSLYARQIKTYMQYFRRDQFHFVVLEEFKQNPLDALNDVCSFLGVAPLAVLPDIENANVAGLPRSLWAQHFLRGSSSVKKVLGRFVPQRYKYPIVEFALRLNKRRAVYAPLAADLAQQLRVRFADDVIELEHIAGKSLGMWWPGLGTGTPERGSIEACARSGDKGVYGAA